MSRHSEAFNELMVASNALNETRDCTVKALTAATGLDYADCHEALRKQGRKNRRGTSVFAMRCAAKALGFKMEQLPRAEYSAKTMRTVPRDRKLQTGNFIVSMSGHVAALIDGDVIDWTTGRLNRVQNIFRVTGAAVAPKPAIQAPTHNWRAVPSQLALFA